MDNFTCQRDVWKTATPITPTRPSRFISVSRLITFDWAWLKITRTWWALINFSAPGLNKTFQRSYASPSVGQGYDIAVPECCPLMDGVWKRTQIFLHGPHFLDYSMHRVIKHKLPSSKQTPLLLTPKHLSGSLLVFFPFSLSPSFFPFPETKELLYTLINATWERNVLTHFLVKPFTASLWSDVDLLLMWRLFLSYNNVMYLQKTIMTTDHIFWAFFAADTAN